jgi:hypothetical protein
LIIAAAWFSGAAALAVLAPAGLRAGGPAVPAVAAAAAVGGAVAGAAPTGLGALDAALAGAFAGALALAAARAHPAAVALAAGVVAIAGTDAGWGWLAFAGAGVAAAGLTTGVRAPVLGAVAGALVAQAALRLELSGVGVSALVAALALAVVAVAALAASAPGLRRRVLVGTGAVVVVAGLATVAFGAAALAARPRLEQGVASARGGFDATRVGDTGAGVRQLEEAAGAFADARNRLQAWWARPARLVPAVARNALALEQVASSGAELARVAASAAAEADPGAVRLRGGAVDVAAVEALQEPLARVAAALGRADAELAAARSPWLAPRLRRALDDLAGRVGDAAPAAADAAAVAEVAPAFLGGEGPRRYFLALLTPVELRGSGGLLGNFGELTAIDGRLELVRTGRSVDLNTANTTEPAQLAPLPGYLKRFERPGQRLLWQDITLSPHFPAVADTIERFYPLYGGAPVDGVISLDPLALAALLELTGPVSVAEWPEPIDAGNAADVLLREQYLRLGTEGFTNPERVEFLDSLVRAVFDRLLAGELPGPGRVGEVLGPAVRQGRIQLHSTVADEQAVFERLGAAGALTPVVGDYAALVTNNSSGNKIDLFLDRSLSYRVAYDPASGATSATAEIRLDNRAPAEGLPHYLIGSGGPVEVPPGTNRLYLSFYSPLALDGATIEGQPLPMEAGRDHERNMYSAFVAIPPGESRTVTLELSGELAPAPTYRLDLGHQATIEPDTVEVQVEPTPGWRVDRVNGLAVAGEAAGAGLALPLDRDQWVTAGFARE